MDKLIMNLSSLAMASCFSLVAYSTQIPELLDPDKLDPSHRVAIDYSAEMQRDEVREMLRVWNQVNDDLNMKCSECHSSPMATEFAIAGIDENDIFRRGIVHHSSEDIDALIAGSKVLSEALGLPDPGELDRDDVFIMQPAGKPTEGHYYFERDYSFAKNEIVKHTPTFAGHIPDMETAELAWEEFKSLTNPNNIRVPWLSPVYSGDTFVSESRGEKTGTIHKWVSLVPIQPLNDEAASEIDARRIAYINYPSNEHFDNLFHAVRTGAGPFGFHLDEFGRSFGTRGKGQSEGVASHELAKDLSAAAADYEMQKYLMGMIAFHTELQELTGQTPVMNDVRGAYDLRHNPDAHFSDRSNAPRDKLTFLKVGDAAGQTLGDAQLRYPDFVLENFLAGKFEQGSGAKSKNEVNKHARYGAPDWWHMSLHYSIFTPDGFYWQGDNKLHGPVHTPWIDGVERTRENAMPGYPVYNNWVSMRRHALRSTLSDDTAKNVNTLHGGMRMTLGSHLSGLTNPTSMANDDHWRLTLRSLVNYSKIVMMLHYNNYKDRNRVDGKYLNQNKIYISEALRYARELDEIEGNQDYREYETLKAMFEQAYDSANQAYARDYNGAEVNYVEGQGNGLRLEVFDDPDFEVKLSDYIVATADATMHRETSLQGQTWGNNLYSKLGSAGHAFDTNYIDGDIDGASFRYSGFIQVPSSDVWDIWEVAGGRTDTGVKITLNNQVVFDKPAGLRVNAMIQGSGAQFQEMTHTTRTRFCGGESNVRKCDFDYINPMFLEAGELYPIEIEIRVPADENDPNTRDVGGTYLVWSAEKTRPTEGVPKEYLYSSREAVASSLPEIINTGLARELEPSPHQIPDPFVWLETSPGAALEHQFEAESDNGPVRFMLAGKVPSGVSVTEDGKLQGIAPPTWRQGNRGARYNPHRNEVHDFTLVAIDADNEAHQVPIRIVNLTAGASDSGTGSGGTGGGDTGGTGNGGDSGNHDNTPPANGIRLEAEAFTLSGAYRIETNAAASNGQLISLLVPGGPQVTNASGDASIIFAGAAGKYRLGLGYFDENDGQSSVSVSLNDTVLDGVTFSENRGQGNASARTFAEYQVAEVVLSPGDTLSLTGLRDGEEYARIDYLDLEQIEGEDSYEPPPAPQNPVNTPLTAIGIGNFSGTAERDGDRIYVNAEGSGTMGSKVSRDNLVFIPLAENLSTDGEVEMRLGVDSDTIDDHEFVAIAVRQTMAADAKTYILGRKPKGGMFRWTRRVEGKRLNTANASGRIQFKIRQGKVWNVQFDEGYSVGLVVASNAPNTPVDVTIKDVTVKGID